MSENEIRDNLINIYLDLLRIKAAETGTNNELDFQIERAKIRLQPYSVDFGKLEKMILGK